MGWKETDDSPTRIRELLRERELALKKRWGQNFMISRAARERIVDELDPQPGERVWEIGSGLGGITEIVLDRGAAVTVFEIDYGLMAVIRDRFGSRVSIVEGDAVKTLADRESSPERIVGNLPYRSAAAIVGTILESPRYLEAVTRLVFTVQREMALRMVAGPGTSDYSPFSVLCSITTEARLAGDLSRGNFYPAPDVVSSIVVMEPRPIDPRLRKRAAIAARSLFSQRRKTVSNTAATLAAALGRDIEAIRTLIADSGLPLSARAEEIAPEQFPELAARLGTGEDS
ncbi:MAG: 16S rRNA (adenine(1518)-N(6)/adenine(1519)-N(6))-dimethyltransferase RsmA [Spirochaetota bacterium]